VLLLENKHDDDDDDVILLKCLKFLRDLTMLATVLRLPGTLLCDSQDSVIIHINSIKPILDLTLGDFPFQFVQ